MSDTKHTPGPWVFTPVRSGFCIESEHEIIVDTRDFEGRYGAIDTEANARLIAAAPELLEALKVVSDAFADYVCDADFQEYCYPDNSYRKIMSKARAAIAKAEGRQP